jgi:hypothetical protein
MNKPITKNEYDELVKAGKTLCDFCENTEDCSMCQVTILLNDADIEAIDAGIIEEDW